MVTIITYGIDPFSLTQLSKDISPKLCDLFEIHADDINFYATEGLFIHDGIDQNTWYVVIKVMLPRKLQIFQKDAAKIISNYYKNVVIHMEIIFEYYLTNEREVFINHEYPKYLTEGNVVNVEESEEDEEIDMSDIYTGDAFENFRDKLGD